MESKVKVYEYLVAKEWFGNLEKGTRLYYDHNRQGYVYHYERDDVSNDNRYSYKSVKVEDYFISATLADENIKKGELETGPEIGELESKTNK